MGIDITAYDCERPCEFWPDPKGEGVTLFQDLNHFRTGNRSSKVCQKFCSLGPTGRFEATSMTFVTGFTQDN